MVSCGESVVPEVSGVFKDEVDGGFGGAAVAVGYEYGSPLPRRLKRLQPSTSRSFRNDRDAVTMITRNQAVRRPRINQDHYNRRLSQLRYVGRNKR